MQQSSRAGRLFDLFDADHDGAISEHDFTLMQQRVASSFGVQADSSKAATLQSRYSQAWEQVRAADGDGDGRVTREEYVEAIGDSPDAASGSLAESIVEAEFAVADSDDDGVLSKAEFAKLLAAFGVERAEADEAMAHMDTSQDGRITISEYRDAWTSYMDGSREGAWLLGRPR